MKSEFAVTLNALLVAEVSPEAVACSCTPVPTDCRVKEGKAATPLETVRGPPPTGTTPLQEVRTIVMLAVLLLVTTLLLLSSTLTLTVGAITLPATTDAGCTVKANLAAGPVVMLNELLVTMRLIGGVEVALAVAFNV